MQGFTNVTERLDPPLQCPMYASSLCTHCVFKPEYYCLEYRETSNSGDYLQILPKQHAFPPVKAEPVHQYPTQNTIFFRSIVPV